MNALTVTGVDVRRDEQGRYCLNDLHRAAGGAVKHEPHRWLRNSQTKALIEALESTKFGGFEKAGIPAFSSVPNAGTFVAKQLVYAYAMWISADFNLAVIEAYDALVNGEYVQPAIQVENYWFARRPLWPAIRARVLARETYRAIAAALSINRDRVARAVKSMIRVGILDPRKVAEAQIGPSHKAALRYGIGWGQYSFDFGNTDQAARAS